MTGEQQVNFLSIFDHVVNSIIVAEMHPEQPAGSPKTDPHLPASDTPWL
ncbi:hypothetical protein [uncultured Roseobacter sp.]|nr:hypothetical protein [uncultured Roseobacter sp.]